MPISDSTLDTATRQMVIRLLNVIETFAAENTTLPAAVQHLRDKNARLKGRPGKPDIKPPTSMPADHSSDAERLTRTAAQACSSRLGSGIAPRETDDERFFAGG